MARKTNQVVTASAKPDWFLQEWMQTLHVSQSKLAAACDWSRSTMHGIYHGRTEYYRELVNLVAEKLNIEPFELLMAPERAMAIRQLRATAASIVENDEKKAPLISRTELERTGTRG